MTNEKKAQFIVNNQRLSNNQEKIKNLLNDIAEAKSIMHTISNDCSESAEILVKQNS